MGMTRVLGHPPPREASTHSLRLAPFLGAQRLSDTFSRAGPPSTGFYLGRAHEELRLGATCRVTVPGSLTSYERLKVTREVLAWWLFPPWKSTTGFGV